MTQLHSVASLDYGDGRTCVCRICECGKHTCPGLKIPFIGETTYRDEYVPKAAERDRPHRSRQQAQPTKAEPGHFRTTAQEAADALAGKECRPAESYKPRNQLATPLPFDATTTNRADYPGYMPDNTRVQRKHHQIPKLPGTYGTTKGSMDEPIQGLADRGALPKPPKGFKHEDNAQNGLPFDGVTTYTAEYPNKQVPLSRFKPVNAVDLVPENRDFQTTHGDAYVVPPMHMIHRCPAAQLPARPASQDGHIKLSVYNIPTGNLMAD